MWPATARISKQLSANCAHQSARCGGLADLDQVTVGIAHVAADLGSVDLGLRQKRCAAFTPGVVAGTNIRNANVHEARGSSGLSGVCNVTVGLSSVGPPPTFTIIQLLAS